MKRAQFFSLIYCLLLNQIMFGAAAPSCTLSVPDEIILCTDNNDRVGVPRTVIKYAQLFKDIISEGFDGNDIPLAGRSQAELDSMIRLLSLRSRANSSEQLKSLIKQDMQLSVLSDDAVCELVKFGDYLGCDEMSMDAFISINLSKLSSKIEAIRCLDGFNQKLLLREFVERTSKPLSKIIPLQARLLWQANDRDPAQAVAFSPDGNICAVGKRNGNMYLFTTNNEESKPIICSCGSYVNAVAFSPDGETIASGTEDGTRLWNVATGVCIRRLTTEATKSIAFSSDGTTVASGARSNKATLWNAKTGEPRCVLNVGGTVKSLSFSPDGKTIVVGSQDEAVQAWNVETGQQMGYRSDKIDSAVLSLDGAKIASIMQYYSSDAIICNPQTGKMLCRLKGHTAEITSLSFSPDGKTIASGSRDGTVRLWNVETGICLQILQGHKGIVFAVTFSPDGGTIASASYDSTVRLWRVDYQTDMRSITDVNEMRFLLAAEQDWIAGRAHKVAETNAIYQNLIGRFTYLNSDHLFSFRALTLREQVEQLILKLQDTQRKPIEDAGLQEQVLHAYDQFYDLRVSERPGMSDEAFFDEFIENFLARSPVWRVLLSVRENLVTNYAAGRVARYAQRVAPIEVCSSSEVQSASPSCSSRSMIPEESVQTDSEIQPIEQEVSIPDGNNNTLIALTTAASIGELCRYLGITWLRG